MASYTRILASDAAADANLSRGGAPEVLTDTTSRPPPTRAEGAGLPRCRQPPNEELGRGANHPGRYS